MNFIYWDPHCAKRLYLLCAIFLPFHILTTQAQSVVRFTAIGISNGRDRGDSARAVDGNFGTWSYLTEPFTQGPQTAFLDFGTNVKVNGLGWIKEQQNIDGTGSDYVHSTLSISISTDSTSVPLTRRTFVPVASMVNGYNGNNLVQIDSGGSLSSNGTITREFGKGIGDGLSVGAATYAVTFALTSNATAIAFTFLDTDPIVGNYPPYTNGWTHYPTAEFFGIDTTSMPFSINIQKIKDNAYLTSTNLAVGVNYQIQSSTNLNNWMTQGLSFTATNSSWQSKNVWDLTKGNQMFFRLQKVLP